MKVKILQSFVHKDLGSFIPNEEVEIEDSIANLLIKQNLIIEEKKTYFMKVKILQSFVHKDLGSFIPNEEVEIEDSIANLLIKQNLIIEEKKTIRKKRSKKVD